VYFCRMQWSSLAIATFSSCPSGSSLAFSRSLFTRSTDLSIRFPFLVKCLATALISKMSDKTQRGISGCADTSNRHPVPS
jgi:hypothetical protein